MLTELSLNILDVANNSVRAGASLVIIEIRIHNEDDILTIKITDNGHGMTKEQLSHVEDPFFTTRTTRDVGLGIPFLKQAAEITGGTFSIESILNEQTTVYSTFCLSHIDRMPLGDICSTIYTLIMANPKIDFLYVIECDDKEHQLDTRSLKDILGDLPFDTPTVAEFIHDYLVENYKETTKGYNY